MSFTQHMEGKQGEGNIGEKRRVDIKNEHYK